MDATTDAVAETAAAVEVRETYVRAAGRVDSGPGEAYVHLVFLLSGVGDVWATACPADKGDDPWARQVRKVFAQVDCPVCLAGAGGMVAKVNKLVAERQWVESTYRDVIAKFLAWAASDVDAGGAVLAVYDGGTRLHPMRADERERAVGLWLESIRRPLTGA